MKKQLTTSAAALLSVEKFHLNLAHKVINTIAKENTALASVISATGLKEFGPACYYIDSKKSRILVSCVEGDTAPAVDPKLAALVAAADTAAAAVVPAMAKNGKGRTEATAAADAVTAIVEYCNKLNADAAARAEAVAARRAKVVTDITAFLQTKAVGMDAEAAAAAAPGYKWVKGTKDKEGRFAFKLSDLLNGLFTRYAAAIATLNAATAPATDTPADEAPATDTPADEAPATDTPAATEATAPEAPAATEEAAAI